MDTNYSQNPMLTPDLPVSNNSEACQPFNLNRIKADAEQAQPTPNMQAIAFAVYKIAEVIDCHFYTPAINYMVSPQYIDPYAHPNALPIHFLFHKEGKPAVAVVVSTPNGMKTPNVVATRLICERNGIKYIRMYATGTYADWITGKRMDGSETPQSVINFCKNWVVTTIQNALK